MADFEGVGNYACLAAHRTQQSQTATQNPFDLLEIFFHNAADIVTPRTLDKPARNKIRQ
jgi:hypothetical protein